jgi:glycosyltransferase involved in cell wall biosynthesis
MRKHSKLSIVLATFNCADTLQDCLNSIAEQTVPDVEVIVVDGASTDSTLEIIKANREMITHWISEPDKGIYDAWNKAIQLGSGDWFYFIGGDDKLHANDSIARVMEQIRELPDETVIAYGSVCLTRMNGSTTRTGAEWDQIREDMHAQMCIPHQGAFHARALLDRFGGFDNTLEIAGDYKLIMQSLELAAPVFLVGIVVADQYAGGKSALRKHRTLALSEFRKVQVELGYPLSSAWLWAYAKGLLWLIMSRFRDVRA